MSALILDKQQERCEATQPCHLGCDFCLGEQIFLLVLSPALFEKAEAGGCR